MSKLLKPLKQEFDFLALGSSQALQQTARDLDLAIRSSFKSNDNKRGFPKFKKKGGKGSIRYPQGVSIKAGKIQLPKIKTLLEAVGDLPTEFNSATVLHKPNGKWYISFVIPFNAPNKIEITSDSSCIGVDLNSNRFAVTSEGEYVVNPKHIKQKEKRLKRYQRKHSRCAKGSNNKQKARYKLAKLHEKVANQRKDFVEKVTNDIAKTYDVIAIEDLNVKGMQRWNGRMIESANFGAFKSKMIWKANREGKHLILVGRYEPTSKMCNNCKTLHNMPPKIRTLVCDCGFVIDRDLNAAKNILEIGLQKIGWEPAEFTSPETLRLQDRLSIQWKSMKEEAPCFS